MERRKKYNKLKFTFPETGAYSRDKYPHALKFFEAGKEYRTRCLIAANRVGKSFTAGCEMAYHLTGKYPEWWTGRRFEEPIKAWAAGITNETTKEIIQEILLGSFSDIGSGLIPKDDIVKTVNRPSSPETILAVYVKHYTNGIEDGVSQLTLKAYEQGSDKFQGTPRHLIWLDEEPKEAKIWDECLMRTMKTSDFPGGMMMLTFTPLFGLTEVVLSFLPGGLCPIDHVNPETGSWAIQVTWDDVPHLTAEEKADLLRQCPPHLRDARTRGIPQIGAGAIYPVNPADIEVEPFKIPEWWPKAYGMDVGWHDTAAVFAAQDPNSQVWYIYDEYLVGTAVPPVHAAAIQARGKWIPGAIDPASNRTRDDGSRLLVQYLELGLDVQMANNSIETGISIVREMLLCGKLKVFKTCNNWFAEIRTYHRDDKGNIPDRQRDHLLDATRYLCVSGMNWARVSPSIEEDEDDDYYKYSSKTDLGANPLTGY